MSYVDVDKFAEAICNFPAIDEDIANAMIFLLRSFPNADVEKVVRCSECEYKDECGKEIYLEGGYTKIGYCSYGRKDGKK